MTGYIDLHCHYLPEIDDGVESLEDGLALCRGLKSIGFTKVVATPHIRSAVWPNTKSSLEPVFREFEREASGRSDMPQLGLAAEHFCDDVFFNLFQKGETIPYPGGHAALIELSVDRLPLNLAELFFRINVKGIRPVLAHPERYKPVFKSTEPIEQLIDMGTLPLLDIMSLAGKYGRKPRRAAERMLEEGVYFAACSDSHCLDDIKRVKQGIETLSANWGEEETQRLLVEGPSRILSGKF